MISEFEAPLDFRDLSDKPSGKVIQLMLMSVLIYRSALLGKLIIVPKNFVTDLGSIPQILWSIIPPIGRANRAFVIHDWLCQAGTVTRLQADNVFLEAMNVCEVPLFSSIVMYWGVRLGAWFNWRKYRKMEQVEVAAKS